MSEGNFFEEVYHIVGLVPHGRVTTYGAIADYLAKGSARMVGWAMNHSLGSEIPAHRVVNRHGELTGRNYFPNPFMMQELLENEGITIENNKIQNFELLFWDPARDLKK
jgi:methylated-DNA-protein-cysteine methyltransferase-like protein